MDRYSRSHLSDPALLRNLTTNCGRESRATADVLADLAEVDARKLYLPAGYPSLRAFCVQELGLSEDGAAKRIQAARAARQFPAIFGAVAERRLHLSGVCLLAPWLTPESSNQLLAAAEGQTKAAIERLIAEWFPQLDVPSEVQAIAAPVEPLSPGTGGAGAEQHAPGHAEPLVPGQKEASAPRPRVAPRSPQSFPLRLTMSQELHDKLHYAQELLGHRIPSGDVAQVLEQVLDLAITQLEKRKFAATDKPRQGRRRSTRDRRYIPAHVKRSVWQRDGGQCPFVSETGRRCSARRMLEFDHVREVARGGEATVENLRLRCRAHNQFEAERTFGAAFMNEKRQARRRRAEARARESAAEAQRVARERAAAEAQARTAAEEWAEGEARARATAKEKAEEVIPWLQALGIRAGDARRAAERCETIPEASLEERIRLALTCFGRKPTVIRATPAWVGGGT